MASPHTAPESAIKKPSSFDAHHPPEKKLIDDCVHCGFCLPVCPTYVLWGDEMDSPRGRIYMMKKAAEGEAPLDARLQLHMDNCLGCMSCMTACPSGVQYEKLIEATRTQIERHLPRGTSDSLFRRVLFATFPYAHRLRALALPMLVYQRSGLQKLVRRSGLLKLLPARLLAMESLLPTVPNSLFTQLPTRVMTPKPRRRVGMLSGCVQQVFFQHVNAATLRVLAAEGCEIVIPEIQECCGALMVHSGYEAQAQCAAIRMISAFENENVDAIIINAAGCGSTMKQYGYLLRDDPDWAERAAIFSAKCRDIAEFLCELEPLAPRNPLPLRAAYHDACHLQHAQGIHAQPRTLLAGIPDLEIAEMPDAAICCGSAGVYNLLHPETGEELGDRKVDNLLSTQAEAVISANPGCLLQLMSGLRRRGLDAMPAFHMVELLDASIRGLTADELLRQDRSSRIQAN
ncbi:MAG TPA: heterodisulfide reductase-related iron-sulfur binding cluster [Acidobacteriaceae bacterium]|jgi:glycolate oxidase iron-sulfur subunit|nr:heterodisulfide reductase-related iron-sulfur binding cluster [Acidobacteriaceae bacterium]